MRLSFNKLGPVSVQSPVSARSGNYTGAEDIVDSAVLSQAESEKQGASSVRARRALRLPRLSVVAALLLHGALWNMSAFFVGQVLRLGTNVVLARLVSPSVFGIMMIVRTFSIGIELISDMGFGQNIISNPKSEEPGFYNTVFTFQIMRGAVLWLLLCASAPVIVAVYKVPELIWVIPIAALGSLLTGFNSPARDFLRKQMRFRELGLLEVAVSASSSACLVVLVVISPTVYSLAVGTVLSTFIAMIGTYLLSIKLPLRLQIHREFVGQILHFGKWIFLSSLAYFLSTYCDRLFFAKVVPLSMFGIYSIARSISDLVATLALRLGGNVLFPYVASSQTASRDLLRQKLSPVRWRFLLVSALGIAALTVGSDLVIRTLYDKRYHEATWLLPVLMFGAWFSILAAVNESVLLGIGRPSYSAISNVVKLIALAVALPTSFAYGGLLGASIVVAVADLPKVMALLFGEEREGLSFARQDFLATVAAIIAVMAFEAARWGFGLGTSFDTLPFLLSR